MRKNTNFPREFNISHRVFQKFYALRSKKRAPKKAKAATLTGSRLLSI